MQSLFADLEIDPLRDQFPIAQYIVAWGIHTPKRLAPKTPDYLPDKANLWGEFRLTDSLYLVRRDELSVNSNIGWDAT